MTTTNNSESKIQITNLYKIFGEHPAAMLPYVKDQGMSKETLMDEHKHALGLKDININIDHAEITVIMGLSGSGKSTLIRHLNRLIEPTFGKIMVDGVDVMSLNQTDLRHFRQEKMSMVFQKFALLPHQTVLDNTSLPLIIRGSEREKAYQEAKKWLNRVDLKGFEHCYPHQLSGGMQQRVGLARALTSKNEIMLMDEAFSALDPLIRTNMQDLLLTLQKDLHKTIVFITHDLDEALKLADYLVVLKDGHVVQQGEPQDILLNPNDAYIEDFVSNINRARVLKVRSVMSPLPEGGIDEKLTTIDANSTLESVIELSGGDTTHNYLVLKNKKPVGVLNMKTLFKALVPALREKIA